MHNELGKSLAFAGLILMFNQGLAIVGNLIGGTLFDKLGGYKTIISGALITMLSAIFLAVFNDIVSYAIALMFIGFGSGVTIPAVYAMASSVWPEGGRRAFNAIYVAQNLGVALGASLGGFIAAYSFSYIFIANGVLFIVFFLFAFFGYKQLGKKTNAQTYSTVLDQTKPIKDKSSFIALMILSVGFLICWISYVQWQSTIAPYTQDLGIPINQYSLLWTVNGALIVLGQPLLKMVTKRIDQPKIQIYVGNTIFIFAFIQLLSAEVFTDFMLAMITLTIGEMFVWPAVPTLANALAPKGRAGFYQGFINSVSTAGKMLGPVFGGFIVDQYNIHLLFMIIIGLYIIPYVSTYFYTWPVTSRVTAKKLANSHSPSWWKGM